MRTEMIINKQKKQLTVLYKSPIVSFTNKLLSVSTFYASQTPYTSQQHEFLIVNSQNN